MQDAFLRLTALGDWVPQASTRETLPSWQHWALWNWSTGHAESFWMGYGGMFPWNGSLITSVEGNFWAKPLSPLLTGPSNVGVWGPQRPKQIMSLRNIPNQSSNYQGLHRLNVAKRHTSHSNFLAGCMSWNYLPPGCSFEGREAAAWWCLFWF